MMRRRGIREAAVREIKTIRMNTIGKEFLETVTRRVKFYKDLGEKTFNQLEEEDLHFQPGVESNSIAVIVQHMTGNMLSRWTNFLTEDGEKEWRQRDDEFEVHDMSRQQVIDLWQKGWDFFLETLGSLKEEDLLKVVTIRGESLTVIDAINRQLAHYPYHVGQIVFIGKMRKNDNWKNLSIPMRKS
jgi:hypothetical protein